MTEEKMIEEVKELLDCLKLNIGDSQSEGIEEPMTVTIATDGDSKSWTYQTGDNSYMGSCYHYPYWGVITLSEDSDTLELARLGCEEMFEQMEYNK
jgi:hypothetical protein